DARRQKHPALRRGASSPACEPAVQPASRITCRTHAKAGTNAGLQAGLLAPPRGRQSQFRASTACETMPHYVCGRSMLTRATSVEALSRLSNHLKEKGIVGEISLLGGTAMVLAFQARQATKDVDAIFAPAAVMREAARAVAAEMGLPEGWLNDAAK